MKLCKKQLHKKNTGFTMMELLIVIGIILALLAVSVPAVARLRRNLRQRELDSKAEVVYMAAQARLTQLRTSGFAELYTPKEVGDGTGVTDAIKLPGIPADAAEGNDQLSNLYSVLSEDRGTAYVILPENSLDPSIWRSSWIIEYSPKTASVYAVFYSTESLQGRGNSTQDLFDDLNSLRRKTARLSDGARVGYYGGDINDTGGSSQEEGSVKLEVSNGEKLVLKFSMVSDTKPDTISVTIKDRIRLVGAELQEDRSNAFSFDIDLVQTGGRIYRAEMVLDSLTEGEHFYQVTKGTLQCGTVIKITAREKGKTGQTSIYTNSLFDYVSSQDAAEPNKVYTTYGRHLQNLDVATSQVVNQAKDRFQVTKAVQRNDITFRDTGSEDCWYRVYDNRLFTPITNQALTSYEGLAVADRLAPAISALHIESRLAEVGLFSHFSGRIYNLLVSGPRVIGTDNSSVGVLAGTVSGTTTIDKCQVYLSQREGDLNAARVEQVADLKNQAWVKGGYAGGLIGSANTNTNLTISNSSASTIVDGERFSGGLVGRVNCTANIYHAYADCYLFGGNTGGLVGGAGPNGGISLQNFYAVGYQLAREKAAGIVVFDEKNKPLKAMTNGYAAVDMDLEAGGITAYTTAPSCVKTTNVLYMPTGNLSTGTRENCSGTTYISYADLKDANAPFKMGLTAPFTQGGNGVTAPYNRLQSQSLTTYTYPRMADMTHYGDWSAEFENGALVYYEVDAKGNYRFSGGNLQVDNIPANASDPDYEKRAKIVGDGYALAFLGKQSDNWSAKVALSGKTDALSNQTGFITVSDYCLYPLPCTMVNNVDPKTLDGQFYQKLTIVESITEKGTTTAQPAREAFFNPNFAECFRSGTDTVPSVISVRSPRHLYALSRLYESYSPVLSNQVVVRQSMDLDYDVYKWADYYGKDTDIANQKVLQKEQTAIGTSEVPFKLSYDGGGFTVLNLNLRTADTAVGLFGSVSAAGRVENVVLLGENRNVTYGGKGMGDPAMLDLSVVDGDTGVTTVYMGALVGQNSGYVGNCAVVGYHMNIAAYNGTTVNVGGLIGTNASGGTVSACSADTPDLQMLSYSSNIYGGGLAGINQGNIARSYSCGYLYVTQAKLDQNTVRIAGFAAGNDSGNIAYSYSGMALQGGGDTKMYGFTVKGGSVISCSYLDGGTFDYRDKLYGLNTSKNGYSDVPGVTTVNGAALEGITLKGFGTAEKAVASGSQTKYTYPESLTRDGQFIHYGQWPVQHKDLGTFGVFYWEKEEGGNSGYHLTFLGVSDGKETERVGNLCTSHDDGGVITEYGYGVYYLPTENAGRDTDPRRPQLQTSYCVLGKEDEEASQALHKQLPGYQFVAYKTGIGDEYLHMTGDDDRRDGKKNRDPEENRNARWTLSFTAKDGEEDVTTTAVFSVSPFFADAYSLDSVNGEPTGKGKPGSGKIPYQVRSVEQLQFINWNYGTKNATTEFVSGPPRDDSARNDEAEYALKIYNQYPYLSYVAPYKHYNNVYDSPTALGLNWKQSHDMDGKGKKYTPIGGMYDYAKLDSNASLAVIALFSSTYDGKSYNIKNINIQTNTQCVGLFGVTFKATLENIILYSDDDSSIIHENSSNWYCVGGLVGMAGIGNLSAGETAGTIRNCTVSGYTIVDNESVRPGWGGGCVGGLVGASTMNVDCCSAVTDINIHLTYSNAWMNTRVGGLVGCARGSITNSYAGGSMRSTSDVNWGTYNYATNIWMGGILGGVVLRINGNLASVIGPTKVATTVTNCYSYVQMPAREVQNGRNGIKSSQAIASNGEMQEGFSGLGSDYITITNCYALDSSAALADDYVMMNTPGTDLYRLAQQGKYSGVNLNMTHVQQNSGGSWWDRRIQLDNARYPYLTYQQMKEDMQTYLPNFSPVTTEENNVTVTGKFSFPGSDRELVGLDYPFPTILTQGDNHIHYGAWPKFGIYWQAKKASLDLIADRNPDAVYALEEGEWAAFAEEEETLPEEARETVPDATQETLPEATRETLPNATQETLPEATRETLPETPPETAPETVPPETAALQLLSEVVTEPKATAPETAAPETAVPETTAPEAAGVPEASQAPQETEAPGQTEAAPTEGTVEETLSLMALNARTLNATLEYKLYAEGVDVENVTPTYRLLSLDGKEITGAAIDKAAARIVEPIDEALHTDRNGRSYFAVTFLGQHPGAVRVEATVEQDGRTYTATMTLSVTADLTVSVREGFTLPITVYEGDAAEKVPIVLTDQKGNAFAPGEGASLQWSLACENAGMVSWSTDFLKTNDDGTMAVDTLKGVTAGQGVLQLSLKYKWQSDAQDPGEEDVDSATVEASLSLPIVVYPGDVLGISDGEAYQEVTLPHTAKPGVLSGAKRTYDSDAPALQNTELYLYASAQNDALNAVAYTDLENTQVKKAELNLGQGFRELTQTEEGFALPDTDITVTVGAITVGTNAHFAYRPVTVTGTGDEQWTLRLTLAPKTLEGSVRQETVVLTYARPNRISFRFRTDEKDTLLETLRLEQGERISDLDTQALLLRLEAKVKADNLDAGLNPGEGHHWTWDLPEEDAPTKNVTIFQKSAPISYQIVYEAGYPDYEWDNMGPMDPDTFTYGAETNVLKQCGYVRPGYTFTGWGASEKETDAEKIFDPLTTGCKTWTTDPKTGKTLEHTHIIHLYAQWKPNTYTISFDDGLPEGDENKQTMDPMSYTVDMTTGVLPECAFQKEGKVFAGWACEANANTILLPKGSTLEEAMKHGGDSMIYEDVTLYPVWADSTYKIHYSDGSTQPGTMEDSEFSVDGQNGNLRENTFEKPGYRLVGWAFQPGQTTAQLEPDAGLEEAMKRGGQWVVCQDVTLYAVWEEDPNAVTEAEELTQDEPEEAPEDTLDSEPGDTQDSEPGDGPEDEPEDEPEDPPEAPDGSTPEEDLQEQEGDRDE